MAGGIKLAPLLTEMKVDIASFKSDMSKAAALGVSEADKISKQMSKTAKVGETLSRTGAALTKGLSVIVKTWVELVRNGAYKKESVPKISNLQEIVWKVLEGKVE